MSDTTHKDNVVKGSFRIIVVPTDDIMPAFNDIHNFQPRDIKGTIRVMATAGINGVRKGILQMNPANKARVVKQLRQLADFIENNVVKA